MNHSFSRALHIPYQAAHVPTTSNTLNSHIENDSRMKKGPGWAFVMSARMAHSADEVSSTFSSARTTS